MQAHLGSPKKKGEAECFPFKLSLYMETYMLKSICGNSGGHWFLWTSYLGNIHRGAAVHGAIPFCFLTLTSSHLGCIPKLLFYTLSPFYGKNIGKTRHFLSHSGTERFNLNSSPRGCLACCHFFRRARDSLASLLLWVFCIRSVLGNVAHGCIKLYCKQRIPVGFLAGEQSAEALVPKTVWEWKDTRFSSNVNEASSTLPQKPAQAFMWSSVKRRVISGKVTECS